MKNVVCGSAILGKDMHVNVYGTKGLPVVMFPTLAAAPESLEEAGVIDELAEYLDSGTIQLFCTETIDSESWASDAEAAERAQRQETFYHYVVDELVPLVHKVSGSDARPLAMGCDMGATHAAIALLRRPDLFQGCVCLSGSYDARRYFGEWMDATLYDNTPCAFLPQMPADHPYVAVYNQRQLLFCTGQEASEADSLRCTREMDANLARLGVEAWCDYWGGDVTHGWYWWKKQLRYFLPIVLADVEKTTAAEKPVKKRAATTRKKAATTKKPAAKKPAATKAATKTADAPAAPQKDVKAEKDVKADAPAAKKPAARKTAATKAAAKPESTVAAEDVSAKAPAKKTPAKAAAAKPATRKPAATKAAAKSEEAAKPAAKPAVAKAAKAADEKVAAAPAKAAKAAAPAKAEKPAAPAKAEKPAAPAKPTKAAAPAKAEKPAAPAKAEKPAAPAKAEKPAAPAKPTKAAAPAKATSKRAPKGGASA